MLKFDFISELIYGLLKEEGGKAFSLRDVRKLMRLRNEYLDKTKDNRFDWVKLPKHSKAKWVKEEVEYRSNISRHLIDRMKSSGINVKEEEVDKVLSIENFILVDIGNVRSYYETLELLKKKEITFQYLHEIKRWTQWKRTVEKAIDYFVEVYGLYPNVMLANRHTISQINFIVSNVPADRRNIRNFDEKTLKITPVEKHKEISLVGIRGKRFFVRFINDDEMEDSKFMLYYHDGPFLNWDDDDDDDGPKPVTTPPVSKNVLVLG